MKKKNMMKPMMAVTTTTMVSVSSSMMMLLLIGSRCRTHHQVDQEDDQHHGAHPGDHHCVHDHHRHADHRIVDLLTIRETVWSMTKAAFYLRVSTDSQTVENQLLVLTEVAKRSGWEVVHVFRDEGISGAKGRDKRPGYDALLKAVARHEVQIVAAWSVDRLGRSLPDLVGFLSDIQARGCDLYLHQQAIDTSTPSGRMLFQMLGVFAEFERAMIRERILSGLRRSTKKSGRKPMPEDRVQAIRRSLENGVGIRAAARLHRASPTTVTKIAREIIAA